MQRLRAAALAVALASPGCAGGLPARGASPGVAEGRAYVYSDNSGLIVTTAALDVAQPLTPDLTAHARAVADRILLERAPLEVEHQAGNQATGHHDPDVVSSASAFAAGGEVARKWRFEGTAGLTLAGEVLELPSEVGASIRAGTEPDYGAVSAALSARTELFERNTVVSASLGAGRDTVSPVEPPPGQAALWPASHHRLTAGVTVSQVLSRRLVASGSVAGTLQRGTLENPYRRAIVRTSLFPEQVPDARDRLTASLGLSWYAGRGIALHLRHGIYVDSWGVFGWVPEVSAAKDFGGRVLVLGRYRRYRQLAADFYRARYEELAPILTGDARLGRLAEHLAGAELRWTFLGAPGERGGATAILGYELSFLRYEELPTDVIVAHVPSAGLSLAY